MKTRFHARSKLAIFLVLCMTLLLPVSALAEQGVPNKVNFESGNVDGWAEGSLNGAPVIMPASYGGMAHSGQWSAWLGGTLDDLSYIEKSLTVPTDKPLLSYWQWISSDGACGADTASVLVNGTPLKTFDLCRDTDSEDWILQTVNLGAFAGKTVSVRFEVQTGNLAYSSLFIDDISLSPANNYKTLLPLVRR